MKASHLLIVASFFVSFACTNAPPLPSGIDTIVVKDFRGKEIKLEKPAERVVCLIESALSGIYMLRQHDRIIGVPSAVYGKELFQYYSRLDTRILDKSLPSPGNWDFISIEQIVGLQPDLVIIWSSQTEAIEQLEQFGIPVYAVMLHSFSDVHKEIKDFGVLLDGSEQAEKLINTTKAEMQAIRQTNSTGESKSVYFMWAQGITETSGKNSTVNELLEAAGLRNACDLPAEHVSVSVEKIYDWDPDMIVMWYNEQLNPEDVVQNPLLQGLRAVKEGKVFELPEVFACDFWTLKMPYPAQLISSWASGKNPDAATHTQLRNQMYVQLYGKELLN